MIDESITGPVLPPAAPEPEGFDELDIVAAVGAALVTIAAAFIWLPLAPLVLGCLLLLYAINASRNEQPPETPT